MSALRAVRIGDHGEHGSLCEGRDGAGDESTGRDVASDGGSHFWLTPKVGGKVDPHRLTQVGRALHDLGVQMIPAYSPQARGRSERNFGTWQGRLPQD